MITTLEEPLPLGGACLLGSLNLSEFVKDGKFDEQDFRKSVRIATKALDDIQKEGRDLNPLAIQKETAKKYRQIGLGIMGGGDMLIKLGLRYDSDEGIEFCDKIGKMLFQESYNTSCELGEKYGEVFENARFSDITKYNFDGTVPEKAPHNSQIQTLAPCGCQKPETIVATNKGLLRLCELVDDGGSKWQDKSEEGLESIQQSGNNKITKGFVNGFAKTKKIHLSSGLDLEATLNHKYKVVREGKLVWLESKDLEPGDIFPIKLGYYNNDAHYVLNSAISPHTRQKSDITIPETMTEDLAFLLGCYYANGSNHYKKTKKGKVFHSIRFSMNTKKPDDIVKICNLIKSIFNISPCLEETDRGSTNIYLTSISFCEWLENNNLKKQKALDLQVPLPIRCSSKSDIESFLRGYYMCDGSHTGNHKYIDTASYQMAQDLISLFNSIGKRTGLRIDSERKGGKSASPMYRVSFGLYGSLDFPKSSERYVSKEIRSNNEMVKSLCGEDYTYASVLSIDDGICMTLDIEVENEHYYITSGVLSHNTISTMLNISGGVEPLFALEYTRTTKSLHGKDVTYKVYPKIVEDYFKEHPELDHDISKLPDYFVGAEDIDWHQRIKMQATWQKHIDASISSTINLPKETTVQEVYDIYMEAWKAGLKGVTLFRSNCARIAILNTGSNPKLSEEEFKTTTAPKRPKDLGADFYRIKAGGDNFLIFVGLMDNRPYEVFAMPASDITDIPQTSHGKIVRKKKRQYTYLSDDGSLYWDNISLDPEDYKEWRATTLHVSAMLRHGMPIQSIMKIEDKCNGVITSFNKAIWKVLAKYVPAEDTEELCPQCGTGHIIRENGCEHCDSCGWSRCN